MLIYFRLLIYYVQEKVGFMRDTEDRERVLLVDVSMAGNSAQAVGMVEDFIKKFSLHHPDVSRPVESPEIAARKTRVNVVAGSVLLTQNILAKINQMFRGGDLQMDTVFSSVPQTQQAALDEGFFVKEAPLAEVLETGVFDKGFFADLKPKSLHSPLPPLQPALLVEADLADADTNFQDELDVIDEEPAGSTGEPYQGPELPVFGNAEASKSPDTPSPFEPLGREITPKSAPLAYETAAYQAAEVPTLYLKKNLRSGKTIRFEGNIVIVGDVHAGSELAATGDITVWGELKGIAHAGCAGDYKAEIRALKIEAIQLRIADYIARRPDRIYYHKGLGENGWASELAKVADGEIKITQEMIGR